MVLGQPVFGHGVIWMCSLVLDDLSVQVLLGIFAERDGLDDEELAEQPVGVVISRRSRLGFLQSEGIDVPVLVGTEQFTLQLLEVLVDELLASERVAYALEGIEIIVGLQPVTDLVTELVAYLVLPFRLLGGVVAGIERQHEQEVHVVVEQQQCVTIEQAVIEVRLAVLVVGTVGFLDAVGRVIKLLVHLGRDEEVGDNVVAFGHVVPQFHVRFRLPAFAKDVQVPLDDVAGIGVLFVDGFIAQLVAHLVILAITDVVGVAVVVLNEALGGVEVVNDLAVFLLLVHAVGQRVVADQFINDGLKHDIEVLDQQVFFLGRVDEDLSRLVKEREAEVPQFQRLVAEVFVLNLQQAGLAVALEVGLEALACDEVELAVDFLVKAVLVADVVQDREEDDQQFLIEIDLPFLVDGVQIDRTIVLNYRRLAADGACPVDFVESRVQVLQDEEEVILVVTVELEQLQQDVKIGIAQASAALAHLGDLGVIDNGAVVVAVILIDRDCTVDPHSELIEEVLLGGIHGLILGRFNNVFGRVLAEGQFPTVYVHEQHLGEDEDAISQPGVVEVAHIVYRHATLDVLERVDAVEHVLHP